MRGLICQKRAQRIVHPIRKPRNKADEAIAPKPGWDGAFQAFCFVARLANRARRSAEEGPLWGSDREGAHVRPQRQRSASRAGVASTRYARGVLLRPARSPCYWHRLASRISSRKASVATTRGLFRGSLTPLPPGEGCATARVRVRCRFSCVILNRVRRSALPTHRA